MKNEKYRHFYYWENQMKKSTDLARNPFESLPITKESVFINTVIVNCNTSIVDNCWISFPNVQAAIGYIQNIFITTAFDAYLLPGEEFSIINGSVDAVLEMAESGENCCNKEAIPLMKQFAKEIDNLWLLPEEKCFSEFKNYSLKFNKQWGKVYNVFFHFDVFISPKEMGEEIISQFEEEHMLDYFEEITGLTKEQWLEVYNNVFENEFMREKFIDILNNRLRDII
jgi:hypothetical protein